MAKRMLVIGATSDIALATMEELAKDGWLFHLAGRDSARLSEIAKHISIITKDQTPYSYFETSMPFEHIQRFWTTVLHGNPYSQDYEAYSTYLQSMEFSHAIYNDQIAEHLDQEEEAEEKEKEKAKQDTDPNIVGFDAVLCAIGYLGDQQKAQCDPHESALITQANYSGLIPLLNLAANYFEQQKQGKIIVISSVAGVRGRASNYFYGASKAAMTAYLSGLRIRMRKSKVQVLTVLPGYVATKMVAHKRLPQSITAKPHEVAKDIAKAIKYNKDVIYTSWVWWPIMALVRHIPEFIFKRLHMF